MHFSLVSLFKFLHLTEYPQEPIFIQLVYQLLSLILFFLAFPEKFKTLCPFMPVKTLIRHKGDGTELRNLSFHFCSGGSAMILNPFCGERIYFN